MAKIENNTTAIFDLDGTLIDSHAKLAADVVSTMNRLGVKISLEEAQGDFYELAQKYGFPREEFSREFKKRKSWEQSLRDGEVPIFPETHEVLGSLKSRNVRLGLLSKSIPEYTEQKLDHFNLTPYFEEVVTVHPKVPTKRYGALYLASHLDPGSTSRIYTIGDKDEDVVITRDIEEEFSTPASGFYTNRKSSTLPRKLRDNPRVSLIQNLGDLI